MRWKGRRQSQHVEDRRGTTYRGQGGGGMGNVVFALLKVGGMKTKMLLIVGIIVACAVFQVNPLQLLSLSGGGGQMVSSGGPPPDPEMKAYLATMKADNEEVWSAILAKEGVRYEPARMVIYTGRTQTAGGVADARMGPFYMPADNTIYIDPTFFEELEQRFGAKGDFAQAYVVAHEVAHHIQNLLGLTDRVHGQRGRVSEEEYNRLSVRLELQADFFAGVFAHHGEEKFDFLERGDIEEAMRCAQAIGDDRIQRQTGGLIRPDLFTHGTSEQRARWFNKGFRTGDIHQGDTFAVPYEQL